MVKVLKRIIDVVFIIIIVMLAIYAILRLTKNVAIYKVQTGSMEDGIHVGDYILTKKCKTYEINDVVTYELDGRYVTHRIVKKEGKNVITKGDANNTEDEVIGIDNIKGKVIISGGIVNMLMNFKYAIISFMLVIYLISCYLESIDQKKP